MRTKAFAAILLAVVTLVAFSATRDTPLREALVAKPSPAEVALERALPELIIDGLPFDEAVARLQSAGKVRLMVDWPRLQAAGVDRKTPVHLHVRGIPLADALTRVLAQVSDGSTSRSMNFTPDGGAVLVTGPDVLPRLYVRCYEVSDLVSAHPVQLDARGLPPAAQLVDCQLVDCVRGGLFGGTPATAEERLVDFITDTVAAETWRDNGGYEGSIRFTGGRLVVTQTWANHRRLERVLGMLRDPVAPPGPRAPECFTWNARVQQWVSESPDGAERSLRTVLPAVRIENATLDEAVRSLARLARANVVLDARSVAEAELDRRHLREAGVDVGGPRKRTFDLHDVTLGSALEAVLREYSDSAWKGGFTVEEGLIVVTSESAASRLFTRTYDLRSWPQAGTAASREKGGTHPELTAVAVSIAETVAPESWGVNGARVFCVADRMVVTQTWRNQEAVRRALATMEAAPH